ncbi:hypothetical protein EDP2_3917 [Enterobacter cloacae S611]|uniref:Uncharacterized protein n=1 Tax=Enterobacter cloacae S611 TaxID=1399146 RepID=A0ABN0QCN3_ENTCL|nr:hypothetical protein EDP2_3917 [Enterobacter cloacae S611]
MLNRSIKLAFSGEVFCLPLYDMGLVGFNAMKRVFAHIMTVITANGMGSIVFYMYIQITLSLNPHLLLPRLIFKAQGVGVIYRAIF